MDDGTLDLGVVEQVGDAAFEHVHGSVAMADTHLDGDEHLRSHTRQARLIVGDDVLPELPAEHFIGREPEQARHGWADVGDDALGVDDRHKSRRVLHEGPEGRLATALWATSDDRRTFSALGAIRRHRPLHDSRLESAHAVFSARRRQGRSPNISLGPPAAPIGPAGRWSCRCPRPASGGRVPRRRGPRGTEARSRRRRP